MPKFLCFSGYFYYPAGGWGDFKGAYASVEDAVAANPVDGLEWREVVDLETMTVVEKIPGRHGDDTVYGGDENMLGFRPIISGS